MDKLSLNLYYASMIIYILGGVPLILYTLVLRPVANLYHEDITTMTSPVFGPYGPFLRDVSIISLIFVTLSAIFYFISVYRAKVHGKKLSNKCH